MNVLSWGIEKGGSIFQLNIATFAYFALHNSEKIRTHRFLVPKHDSQLICEVITPVVHKSFNHISFKLRTKGCR